MNIEEANAIINEILGKFDFEKVRAVMVLMDWKWYGTHVPTVDELRETARHHLLQVCMPEDEQSAGSGGFSAYKGGGEVHLVFELESVFLERGRID